MGYLRKIFRRVVSRDRQNNKIDNLGGNNEYHKVSKDGSFESLYLEEMRDNDCGCFGAPGGRCYEQGCGRISCRNCHRHCGDGGGGQVPAGCGKPLCREHQHYLELSAGRVVPFCRSCHGRYVRKERWLGLGRGVKQFFIEEGERTCE